LNAPATRTFRGAPIEARIFQGVKELARSRLLDDPSGPNDVLDELMSKAVTGLYLVANGGTASLADKVTNGNKEYTGPNDDVTCARLLDAFTAARTHRERLMLILQAQEQLQAARLVDRRRVRGTPEWRSVIKADPRSLRAIAAAYDVSVKVVRTIKKGTVPLVDEFSDVP
jgi:hypothetical protein